jgi:hypothetical protein
VRALRASDVSDRYAGGPCGIGELPGAVGHDALDETTTDVGAEPVRQAVNRTDVAGVGGGGVDRNTLEAVDVLRRIV